MIKKVLVCFIFIFICQLNGWATANGKSKKAEKMLSAGNIAGAMEIYGKMIEEKNSESIKEGKEGLAKCLLIQAKDSYTKKISTGTVKAFEDIITKYDETSSVKEASSYLIKSQLCLINQPYKEGKYEVCLKQLVELKSKVSQDVDGISDLNDMLTKTANEIFNIADTQIKSEKYDLALKNLEILYGAFSNDKLITPKVKYMQGSCYRLSNQNDKAVTFYKDVITDFKDTSYCPLALNDMYLIDLVQGNKKEALNKIKQASALAPENSDYMLKTANLLNELGEKDNANKLYSKLLIILQSEIQKAYVGKENIQYKLGQVYLNLGNYSEAEVEFDKALVRNPSMIEAKKGRAAAQFNGKNFSSATKSYEELIKQLSIDLDRLLDTASKETNSMEAAKRVEDVRNEIAYFHYQNALSYEQIGNYERAEDECRLGLEGTSTQEAATTLKRIQSAKEKPKTPTEPPQAQSENPKG